MPRAGGEYLYLRAAFGDLPGFLYVCMSFIIGAASLAAYGAAFSIFLSDARRRCRRPGSTHTCDVVRSDVRVAVRRATGDRHRASSRSSPPSISRASPSAAACRRSSRRSRCVALVGADQRRVPVRPGAARMQDAAASLARSVQAPAASRRARFGFAMLAALWAYSGWQYLPMTAAEVRDPARNVPRAVIGGGLLIVALYLLVNAAYFHALPFEAVVTSSSTAYPDAPAVGARAAQTFLGPNALSLVGDHLPDLDGRLAERRAADARARAVRRRSRRALLRALRTAQPGRERAGRIRCCCTACSPCCSRSPARSISSRISRRWRSCCSGRCRASRCSCFAASCADAPRPFRVPLYPLVPLAFVLIMAGILREHAHRKPRRGRGDVRAARAGSAPVSPVSSTCARCARRTGERAGGLTARVARTMPCRLWQCRNDPRRH